MRAQRSPVKLSATLLAAFLICECISSRILIPSAQGAPPMTFTLSSLSFPNGGEIPKKFTCDGEDMSPALTWAHPPKGTGSFALIADDPDAPAGTWTHWVAFNLPETLTALPEGLTKSNQIPGGGLQGQNDFHKIGYGGPCPPPGKPHRYFFRIYALDGQLNLEPGATKQELERAMQGHILAQAKWTGKYHR